MVKTRFMVKKINCFVGIISLRFMSIHALFRSCRENLRRSVQFIWCAQEPNSKQYYGIERSNTGTNQSRTKFSTKWKISSSGIDRKDKSCPRDIGVLRV